MPSRSSSADPGPAALEKHPAYAQDVGYQTSSDLSPRSFQCKESCESMAELLDERKRARKQEKLADKTERVTGRGEEARRPASRTFYRESKGNRADLDNVIKGIQRRNQRSSAKGREKTSGSRGGDFPIREAEKREAELDEVARRENGAE